MVEEHHRRNRFPRTPDPQQLCDIQQQHYPDHSSVPCDALNVSSSNIECAAQDVVEQGPIPPGELSGPATKFHSYPYKFREVIERAKQLAHCGSTTDPFPSRAWFIDKKSTVYITEAIAEREEKGIVIPLGEHRAASMNCTS